MHGTSIQSERRSIQGRVVQVRTGGVGVPMLLVHGGWGGADLHWSRVDQALAAHHRVLAPDLPGLGEVEGAALPSVAAYADWLLHLLDAFHVERAWLVGNSFGASVAWSLAGRAPERCAGLVLVNGFAMPATPPLLGRLGRTRLGRGLLRRVVGRWIYTPRAIDRAFVDPERVPERLRRAPETTWGLVVPRYVDLLVAGDGPPAPRVLPLLLWGAEDRLPGTRRADAEKLHARLPGSVLRLVEGAGHFPQLEQPEAFVAAMRDFVGDGRAVA